MTPQSLDTKSGGEGVPAVPMVRGGHGAVFCKYPKDILQNFTDRADISIQGKISIGVVSTAHVLCYSTSQDTWLGFGATWFSGRWPCPWLGWNKRSFKVSPTQTVRGSVIL